MQNLPESIEKLWRRLHHKAVLGDDDAPMHWHPHDPAMILIHNNVKLVLEVVQNYQEYTAFGDPCRHLLFFKRMMELSGFLFVVEDKCIHKGQLFIHEVKFANPHFKATMTDDDWELFRARVRTRMVTPRPSPWIMASWYATFGFVPQNDIKVSILGNQQFNKASDRLVVARNRKILRELKAKELVSNIQKRKTTKVNVQHTADILSWAMKQVGFAGPTYGVYNLLNPSKEIKMLIENELISTRATEMGVTLPFQ